MSLQAFCGMTFLFIYLKHFVMWCTCLVELEAEG
jgi:hypothetical protein